MIALVANVADARMRHEGAEALVWPMQLSFAAWTCPGAAACLQQTHSLDCMAVNTPAAQTCPGAGACLQQDYSVDCLNVTMPAAGSAEGSAVFEGVMSSRDTDGAKILLAPDLHKVSTQPFIHQNAGIAVSAIGAFGFQILCRMESQMAKPKTNLSGWDLAV